MGGEILELNNLIGIVLQVSVLIISVILHEISHGYAAFLLGDPTAKYAGRLTLNPVKHLDMWGSFVIPFFMVVSGIGVVFGWAKPVPYNPYNLRNQRWGSAIVGVAGPLANLVIIIVSGLLMMVLYSSNSIWFDFFNLVARINIVLLVFNMLPIPPLDGSKLLFSILPISEQTKSILEQNGFIILLAVLLLFQNFIHYLMGIVFAFFDSIFL